MSPSLRVQQIVVTLLLVVHVFWIANHLRWVANDQINPWKLGGYGMYTVPSPHVRIAITRDTPLGEVAVEKGSYTLRKLVDTFDGMNMHRVFRCAPVGPGVLRAFFEDSPKLHGVDVFIVFMERRFFHNPVVLRWQEQGRVQIQWISDSDFVYGSLFCGNIVTGEVSLS